MSKFCLVDWMANDWDVVPWMTFPTLNELLDARRTAHHSWPCHVACIGSEPIGKTPKRFADLRGDQQYKQTTPTYRRIGPVATFYDIDTGNLPEAWQAEPVAPQLIGGW